MSHVSRYQEHNSEVVPALTKFMLEKQQIRIDTHTLCPQCVYIMPGRDKNYNRKENKVKEQKGATLERTVRKGVSCKR